ncbi:MULTISPECIES: DEAD/DEAH box helicase family protein [unclassified Streptomyces]|uniref:DEAD/DEAH box helicase family protein n=1 Tax=unclassified Streptomyces TaxID=2593676 RepID=UPI001F43711D|nr:MULTISPECIES: DEAD/DEAH box helicase family protein [unclassified Streptomyces]
MPTVAVELRPHQKEAATAAVGVLRTHSRASVIAACGTGKTLIADRTTARVASRGRVLVLVRPGRDARRRRDRSPCRTAPMTGPGRDSRPSRLRDCSPPYAIRAAAPSAPRRRQTRRTATRSEEEPLGREDAGAITGR